MDHWMNPFWFVPMDGNPPPRLSPKSWGVAPGYRHDLLTGYVQLRLKTITPLHVAGIVAAEPGPAMSRRYAYRRRDVAAERDLPMVPGSSLRGMVRGYVEALTNGVASSFVQGYEKKNGRVRGQDGRHIGYWVGKPNPKKIHERNGGRFLYGDRDGPHLVDRPAHVFPDPDLGDETDLEVDPATLMFGLVGWGAEEKDKSSTRVAGLRGRVRFEDAWFADKDLAMFPSLDLNSAAAFGGPKPVKSNWWYFTSGEIRERRVQHRRIAEFVGGQLRGRKFYFHQEPQRCIQYYRHEWTHQTLVQVETEAVRPGRTSRSFRVYFEDLPRSLVGLLLAALFPSNGVRHKAGALRPFGFGSVEFELDGVFVERRGLGALDLTQESHLRDADLEALAAGGGARRANDGNNRELELVHKSRDGRAVFLTNKTAWTYLRLICFCPQQLNGADRFFVYPPYRQGGRIADLERGFARPTRAEEVERAVSERLPIRSGPELQGAVKALARQEKRVAIDLDLYQHNARNFIAIKQQALGQ